jgi:DNA ligase-1
MTETTSRIELTNILSDLLKQTPKEFISQVCYMTQGKLHPDFEGIELGIAEKTVSKALQRAYGTDPSKIQELLRKTGDLGDVASQLAKNKSQQALFSERLTVKKVYDTLDEIAKSTGQGSIEVRINKLAALLNSADPIEAKFLVRFVTGKLRLGVADYTVLDALAVAFTGDKKNRSRLEKAYNLTSDLGYVAQLLVGSGIESVDKVKVTVGKPVRPMLAERMDSSEKIIERLSGDAASEYKLDGERVQIHKSFSGQVELYSRRLERITSHFGDVVEAVSTLPVKSLIVEGEVVALDREGKYLPFQELMHRRRKYGVEEAMKNYPVSLNLFDILLQDGKELIDESYSSRRNALEKLYSKSKSSDTISLVPAKRVSSAEEIDKMMEEALSLGCEGLVIKDPRSSYRAGAREFAWIKYKPEYITGVRDTLDLVIVGASYGMGRRAGTFGTFLLAAYDPKADVFRTTTKVGTGFSDSDLEHLTKLLSKYKLETKNPRVDARVAPDVWFEPRVVIEILASEITLSPVYTAGLDSVRKGSGLALRFPKFTGKIRDDKAPEDATTVDELLELYKKQIRQFKSSSAEDEAAIESKNESD